MLPSRFPHLCAHSPHTKLSAYLQQAAIRTSAVLLVNFAWERCLAATLEQLRVAKVRLILPITPFARKSTHTKALVPSARRFGFALTCI